jgi:hypothetical protein
LSLSICAIISAFAMSKRIDITYDKSCSPLSLLLGVFTQANEMLVLSMISCTLVVV